MLKPELVPDFVVVSQARQVAVLADPTRLTILRCLALHARTGAELAREIDLPANQVHYHLGQLLEHGLILEAGRGRKRWKEERYYQAVARHFVVDPRVGCHDRETAALLERSMESAFLDWRRETLLKIDLAQVARQIVTECLGVRPGEKIIIIHGPQGFPLAELIHVELAALHCRVQTRPWSYATVMGTLNRHDADSLRELPFVPSEMDEGLDCVITLSSNLPEGRPPSAEQMAKLPLLLESLSRWHHSLLCRGVRYVEFALPFRRVFEFGGRSAEEAIDIFWRCIRVDHADLARRAARLREKMAGESRLSFTCTRGTALTLEVEPNRSFVLDGRVSPEDAAAGHHFEGLPAGTLNFFPIAEATSGVFHGDYTFHGGMHLEDLTVRLEEGRVVEVLGGGAEVIRRRLENSTGDSNLLAGVSIGLNPAGRGPTGMPVLDACLEGTVTLHFGNNELAGGHVRSTFNMALPSSRLTVESAGQQLITSGILSDEHQE